MEQHEIDDHTRADAYGNILISVEATDNSVYSIPFIVDKLGRLRAIQLRVNAYERRFPIFKAGRM